MPDKIRRNTKPDLSHLLPVRKVLSLNMEEAIMDRDLLEETELSCGDLRGSDQEECIRFYEERAEEEEEKPTSDEGGK